MDDHLCCRVDNAECFPDDAYSAADIWEWIMCVAALSVDCSNSTSHTVYNVCNAADNVYST